MSAGRKDNCTDAVHRRLGLAFVRAGRASRHPHPGSIENEFLNKNSIAGYWEASPDKVTGHVQGPQPRPAGAGARHRRPRGRHLLFAALQRRPVRVPPRHSAQATGALAAARNADGGRRVALVRHQAEPRLGALHGARPRAAHPAVPPREGLPGQVRVGGAAGRIRGRACWITLLINRQILSSYDLEVNPSVSHVNAVSPASAILTDGRDGCSRQFWQETHCLPYKLGNL